MPDVSEKIATDLDDVPLGSVLLITSPHATVADSVGWEVGIGDEVAGGAENAGVGGAGFESTGAVGAALGMGVQAAASVNANAKTAVRRIQTPISAGLSR